MEEDRSPENRSLALDSKSHLNEYYQTLHRETRMEWKKFIQGDVVDSRIVPRDVLDSWLRCRQMGVDPLAEPENIILEGRELNELLEKNHDFIATSLPFMENLYRFLQGSGFLVCLLDHQGYMLELIGDHDEYQLLQNAHVCVGSLWNEKICGTNGGAMIHMRRKPAQLIGSQHFKKIYHHESASSAPIFDAEGNLLGGLLLSARCYRTTPHTLGMAVAAAQAIENELKIKKSVEALQNAYEELEITSSYQKAVIGSIPEALIAISQDGVISLANENAKKWFGSRQREMKGLTLNKFFGKRNHPWLSLLDKKESLVNHQIKVFAKNKNTIIDYLLTCNPIRTPDQKIIGKILIFGEISKARKLATRMMGAKANYCFEDICGENPHFLMTIAQAKMVAKSQSTLLLLGKSGTGKDLFAEAVHNAGSRKEGPFVAINCAAIPRDLITSELFGYSEGAFTGSRRGGSQGKFELADGGTIFLDEIAETPLDMQAALLRVIEDKIITPIGSKSSQSVDVRIIAATNKDLREEIRKGTFREDLYYRLNVFKIEMVPLCERPDDIPRLVNFFVNKFCSAMGKNINKIDEKILEQFMAYPWPGNVRELKNVIERMINYCATNELTADLIPLEIMNNHNTSSVLEFIESPEEKERKMIQNLLMLKFPKNKIAEKMNFSRATLYNKIKKYGIS